LAHGHINPAQIWKNCKLNPLKMTNENLQFEFEFEHGRVPAKVHRGSTASIWDNHGSMLDIGSASSTRRSAEASISWHPNVWLCLGSHCCSCFAQLCYFV
jgi:hypothetical protein